MLSRQLFSFHSACKCEYENFINCLRHLGLPDPPRNVRYVDWDVDRIDIEWDTPLKDGGAPILHYTVEMKIGRPGETWNEVGKTDGPKRFFSKKELKKGEKYEFRVRAVNKAGPSEPSEPSQLMICKARKRKPTNPRNVNFFMHSNSFLLLQLGR